MNFHKTCFIIESLEVVHVLMTRSQVSPINIMSSWVLNSIVLIWQTCDDHHIHAQEDISYISYGFTHSDLLPSLSTPQWVSKRILSGSSSLLCIYFIPPFLPSILIFLLCPTNYISSPSFKHIPQINSSSTSTKDIYYRLKAPVSWSFWKTDLPVFHLKFSYIKVLNTKWVMIFLIFPSFFIFEAPWK